MGENRDGNNREIFMSTTGIQDVNLRNLINTGAFRFIDESTPWFFYTSGQVGPYYVQSVAVEQDGEAYACAIDSIVRLISEKAGAFDVISGGETRDWDFSNPAAAALRKPHLKMYKDGRRLGAEVRGRRVLHVADLNNEGSSVRDFWRPSIAAAGGELVGVLSFVDRMEEGFELFQKMRLPSLAVVPLDRHAWDLIHAEGVISAALHRRLVKRMRDRRLWALDALRANPDYFRKFHSAEATRGKAEKIMNTYPEAAAKLKEFIAHAH